MRALGPAIEGGFSIVGAPDIVFDAVAVDHLNSVRARLVLDFGSFVRVPGSWRDFPMNGRSARRPVRGTSLVEAVVAMAVMAFGMLAVVGVQSTLRLNADVAKQRSEAVRIAQEAMEAARGFGVIEAPATDRRAYADIGDVRARRWPATPPTPPSR